MRGELGKFQERRAGIEQGVDPVAREKLAAVLMPLARLRAAAQRGAGHLRAQIGHKFRHRRRVGAKLRAARVGGRRQDHQADSLNNSRPISMRRISLVPAPISYSLASRSRRPVG